MLTKICYYYKYEVDYVWGLDVATFKMLFDCVDRFKAQDMLNDFAISSFPSMSDKDRNKKHKEVFKIAYPDELVKKVITADDLKKHGLKGLK